MQYSRIYFLAVLVFLSSILGGGCNSKGGVSASAPGAEDISSRSSDPEISKIEELIKANPEKAGPYNRLASIYIKKARETGDFSLNSNAEAAVKKALAAEADNLDSLKLQASLHLTFHRFAEALEAGKVLVKENPSDSMIYGILTDANVELGNYEEAVNAAQKMIDLKPNMLSYSRVGYVRSLHGDPEGAIEAMQMAAKTADPLDAEAQAWCLVHLGDEYFKIGKFDEAEKAYDPALKLMPAYAPALAAKAKIYAARNDIENAKKFYLDAQERSPLADTVIALGDIYMKGGENEKARNQYDLAEIIEGRLENNDQRRLALLWADQNIKLDEALKIAEKEHSLRKDIFTADIYAWCLYKKGRLSEAEQAIKEAMRLKTKDARIFYHAGMIAKDLGNMAESKRLLKMALDLNPAFDILQAENARKAL